MVFSVDNVPMDIVRIFLLQDMFLLFSHSLLVLLSL